ncbi:hypothetical protein D7Z54_33080 [Salibacterium salarium]|uniref:Phage XkdN-like tail assembly chaperone protein, TAC n=1 Tax=Salibacterium salarium TaxID=284579 RepID=A0A428MSJ8_9BACI|nr:hypothetical protein [Salibacterium salarium]RSL29099.1 hypothetical protein D7Z54_33080 [Salibacterium salarium]
MSEQNTSTIDALLAADPNVEESIYINRLGVYFTVRALKGNTIDKLQEQCTYHNPKKKGKNKREIDEEKLGSLMITESCVNPDFSNPQLLEKYNASNAAECVKSALLAGEIITLSNAVLDASGYNNGDDEEDELDEVKN